MLMLLLLLDLGLIEKTTSSRAVVGESGGEESEEDEEWNYIKVEEANSQKELSVVEENVESAISPASEEIAFGVEKGEQEIEDEKEEEPPTAPIEQANNQFEFNVSAFKVYALSLSKQQ